MNMESMFNGLFGKIAPGMCRLSMNGGIAVKTSNGYKTYNMKTNRLTNCNSFVFDIGEDFFFLIPTNHVQKGDIILVGGKPRCVVKPGKDQITVINYEDSTIENILPERHIFMGNTYFYGKIVSMFGNSISTKSKNGLGNIMKYMMMSEMMKGNSSGNNTNMMGNMLPMMMLSGGSFENMFDGMFDFDMDVNFDDAEDESEDTKDDEKVRSVE